MSEKTDYKLAPREFVAQLNDLRPGEKAVLRRAEAPELLAPFWQCYNPAKKLDNQLDVNNCTRLIPFAELLKQQSINENTISKGIGLWLRANKDKINMRRIESVFAAETLDELLDDLLSIASITKDGNPEIDFGRLYWDIQNFKNIQKRQDTLRSWARDYFSTDL